MRIRDNNGIETIKKKARMDFLKTECYYGKHVWGPSAALDYEKCQRSFCKAVRKIEKIDGNSRGQA